MLDALRATAATWVSRWVSDSPLPGSLTLVALDAKIDDLKSRAHTHKRELDHLKCMYRDAARDAAHLDQSIPADDPALVDVRCELAEIVETYMDRLRKYNRAWQASQVLRQYWVVANHRASDDPPDIDSYHSWLDGSARPPKTTGELDDWVRRVIEDGFPPRLEDVAVDREDSRSSDLAETAVTAARTSADVPTLYALVEDEPGQGEWSETVDLDVDVSTPDGSNPND